MGWRSDFSLGYLYRHARLGFEKAKVEHWCGWLQRQYPSDELAASTYLALVADEFPVDAGWLKEKYSTLADTIDDPESGFAQGVVWADRVWHSVEGDVAIGDEIGLSVREMQSDYFRILGSASSRTIGFRKPKQYYRFLIARTLGPRGFNRSFSDAEIKALLGSSSK